MRVTIFGAGALGSVIGGLMAESHTVTLVCRKDHANEINADGLWLDGLVERRAFPHATIDTKGLPIQDLVIVTVKAYDMRMAMTSMDPLLGEETSILVVQNGLSILRDVKELHPGASIGTTSLGAQYIGPGHVRLTGLGEMVIGNPDDADDLSEEVWKKAVISSCINPLTAITRKRNAILIDDRGINDLAKLCFAESFSVGVWVGNLDEGDMTFSDVEKVARATAANRSSMLQDVERSKRTEIHHINGEIVRIGNEAGLDVQVNRVLVRLVSALSP
jgi:2-dehydropantoate 2-reductase